MKRDLQTGEEFFLELKGKIELAFNNAPISQKPGSTFAICETSIQKGRDIILGLNWGGTKEISQADYPKPTKDRKWNFATHSMKYFIKYLQITSIDEINYSNLCFFRSKKIEDLEKCDWILSIPILKEYVEFIQPAKVVLLGTTGLRYLKGDTDTSLPQVVVRGKKKTGYGYKGLLFGKYNFYCLPHPQAKLEKGMRDEIWEKLFMGEENK